MKDPASERLAIICYQCNSAYDPQCGDPFNPYSIGFVNCSLKQVPEHLRPMNVTAVICRKNVQKVYGKFRVVRGCGYLMDTSLKEGRPCVQRSGTHDVSVQYCACEGDKCNGAPGLRPPPSALAAALLLLLPAIAAIL
ncbi:Protein quiver [Gryllus bimaculatus]|nr:Protein quiver [Gryllus bimaculatus]